MLINSKQLLTPRGSTPTFSNLPACRIHNLSFRTSQNVPSYSIEGSLSSISLPMRMCSKFIIAQSTRIPTSSPAPRAVGNPRCVEGPAYLQNSPHPPKIWDRRLAGLSRPPPKLISLTKHTDEPERIRRRHSLLVPKTRHPILRASAHNSALLRQCH